jgi:hypothetical protein
MCAAYEYQSLLSITQVSHGFHCVSEGNFSFWLKKCIYNYFVKLVDSIQILCLDSSQPFSKYLESNRGSSLELSDETHFLKGRFTQTGKEWVSHKIYLQFFIKQRRRRHIDKQGKEEKQRKLKKESNALPPN